MSLVSAPGAGAGEPHLITRLPVVSSTGINYYKRCGGQKRIAQRIEDGGGGGGEGVPAAKAAPTAARQASGGAPSSAPMRGTPGMAQQPARVEEARA